MLTTDKIKGLEEKKAKLIADETARITAEIDAEIKKARVLQEGREGLNQLVERFGYKNAKEFLIAIDLLPSDAKPARAAGTRKRLTPEDRAKIAEVIKAGGKTGAEIANIFAVSVPTIQNIKKQFGLVKSRS